MYSIIVDRWWWIGLLSQGKPKLAVMRSTSAVLIMFSTPRFTQKRQRSDWTGRTAQQSRNRVKTQADPTWPGLDTILSSLWHYGLTQIDDISSSAAQNFLTLPFRTSSDLNAIALIIGKKTDKRTERKIKQPSLSQISLKITNVSLHFNDLCLSVHVKIILLQYRQIILNNKDNNANTI